MALCSLLVLPLLDLAVFESKHAQIAIPHVQAHAIEMSHGHGDMTAEVNEALDHETRNDIKAHISFHVHVSDYVVTHRIETMRMSDISATYLPYTAQPPNGLSSRPSVPPPLA